MHPSTPQPYYPQPPAGTAPHYAETPPPDGAPYYAEPSAPPPPPPGGGPYYDSTPPGAAGPYYAGTWAPPPPPPPPGAGPYYAGTWAPPPGTGPYCAGTWAPANGIPMTVVPGTFQAQSRAAPVGWSTGLFDCLDDPSNCVIALLFPCITFGQVAEIIDKGSTSCGTSGALYALIMYMTGCACVYSCFYRSKLRAQYGLPEEPCPDFLVHYVCELCSLCQMYRELKNRGFDMTAGWHSTMERAQGMQMPAVPPPPQLMAR